jgi:hypothetical protein
MLLLQQNVQSAMDPACLTVKPVKLRGGCLVDDATQKVRSNVRNAMGVASSKLAPNAMEAETLSANMAMSWESVAPAKVLDDSTAVHVLEAVYSNAGTVAVAVL